MQHRCFARSGPQPPSPRPHQVPRSQVLWPAQCCFRNPSYQIDFNLLMLTMTPPCTKVIEFHKILSLDCYSSPYICSFYATSSERTTYTTIVTQMTPSCTYSGGNKYLIPCRFCKFAHCQINEVYNFNGRFILTVRDRISNKKSRKSQNIKVMN